MISAHATTLQRASPLPFHVIWLMSASWYKKNAQTYKKIRKVLLFRVKKDKKPSSFTLKRLKAKPVKFDVLLPTLTFMWITLASSSIECSGSWTSGASATTQQHKDNTTRQLIDQSNNQVIAQTNSFYYLLISHSSPWCPLCLDFLQREFIWILLVMWYSILIILLGAWVNQSNRVFAQRFSISSMIV